jgi:hypothetical protein
MSARKTKAAMFYLTVLIPAGQQRIVHQSIFSFVRLVEMTSGGTIEARVGKDGAMGPWAVGHWFQAMLGDIFDQPDEFVVRNTSGIAVTLKFAMAVGAILGDDRFLVDASATQPGVLVKPYVDGPTLFQQQVGSWLLASGGTAQNQVIVSSGTNTGGIDVAAGSTIITDPMIPGSYGLLRNSPGYIGGSFEGQQWVLPTKTRIPAGITLSIQFFGQIKYSIGYQLL